MKVQTLTCPACGANLEIKEGREFFFCEYCGRKIIVQDENKHSYYYYNDADIKRAENEKIFRMKELELEEKENKSRKQFIKIWVIALIVMGIIGIFNPMVLLIAMAVGAWGLVFLMDSNEKRSELKRQRMLRPNDVMIPPNLVMCEDKNYNEVVALFKSVGFTNVIAVPLQDLNFLTKRQNGKVESVTINGSAYKKNDIFDKAAYVSITYHSL